MRKEGGERDVEDVIEGAIWRGGCLGACGVLFGGHVCDRTHVPCGCVYVTCFSD